MNWKQFYKLVLVPTLKRLDPQIPYSQEADILVSETIFHESQGLNYLAQVPNNGPGLGISMYERPTWDWLSNHEDYKWVVEIWGGINGKPQFEDLAGNLFLSVAMCRVRYRVAKDPLPSLTKGVTARADYWGKYYQTDNDPEKKAQYIYNANILLTI